MYIVVNIPTWRPVDSRKYKNVIPAHRNADRRMKKDPNLDLKVITEDAWRAADIDVLVTNIHGNQCWVRRSDLGSCCDPSTERYWSM